MNTNPIRLHSQNRFENPSNRPSLFAPVIDLRARIQSIQSAIPANPNRVKASETVVGQLYPVQGKYYLFDQDGFVRDSETEELIFDTQIIDKVFEQYENGLSFSGIVRRKVRKLAYGDSSLENSLNAYFTFLGREPADEGEPELHQAA